MLQTDNPELEYGAWLRVADEVPPTLFSLSGVNIKDQVQFRGSIMPTFSRNHATIDFFLSHLVFPKEAKEFPSKLATSGCDLAAAKDHITTGFR
jgi:hypothetical protein